MDNNVRRLKGEYEPGPELEGPGPSSMSVIIKP